MRRKMLAALAAVSLLTGLTGFPTGTPVSPVLAQGRDVLVLEGLQLPRTHRYEIYNAQTGGYAGVAIDAVPRHVRLGAWIYDRTAERWVSHPSVGNPDPQYVASGRDARQEAWRDQDVQVHDGLRLPRSHRYEVYVPATTSYAGVSIDTVPGHVRLGTSVYDRTADAWVSHPSVGQPNPMYAASGRESRRDDQRGQWGDVVAHDGLRLPRSHQYERYNPASGTYGSVTIDTVSAHVQQGTWIYDRTADLWVSHPSVGQPNPQYAASGRDSQYGGPGRDSRRGEELLGQLEVDFRADSDILQVGREEGRFQKIRLVVRGAPIELRDVRVTFTDNSVFDPESRSRILREDSAFVFDLPGQRRVIKSIALQYRSIDRREGRATVLVYGEH